MSAVSSTSSAARSDKPSLATYPFIAIIYLYRLILSPILSTLMGHCCRFTPSCSRYAEEALTKHGLMAGGRMAIGRILRCHPWHEGGYDPVE